MHYFFGNVGIEPIFMLAPGAQGSEMLFEELFKSSIVVLYSMHGCIVAINSKWLVSVHGKSKCPLKIVI